MNRIYLALLLVVSAAVSQAAPTETPVKPADDVIGRVGDKPISFSQINTILNSSAVVGVSIPALGTPQRDRVRITLLDRLVSANLIYLDALEKGVNKEPEYRDAMRRYENATLAMLYGKKELTGDTSISEEEIQKYYRESVVPGTELTDEARAQIEAILRKKKIELEKIRVALAIQDLRNTLGVTVHEDRIDSDGDANRADDEVLAQIGQESITWGEMKARLIAAGKGAVKRNVLAMPEEGRLAALNNEIDTRALAQMARKAGLQDDPGYQRRIGEYGKTRLINLHRAGLATEFDPDEQALADYYQEHRARIHIPEARKVQMVVVDSQKQAQEIRDAIEKGDTTMYEAASEHSIDPGAKKNLGEIGWVVPGEGQPALSRAVFELGPGEISDPIETPAGWHLLTVTDVREEQFGDLSEPATRKRTRRAYIHDKLNAYVVDLRLNHFKVEIDQAKLIQLAQAEADMVRTLAEQAAKPGSVTQTRLQQMMEMMKQSLPAEGAKAQAGEQKRSEGG